MNRLAQSHNKVILVGEYGVGKTCLADRMKNHQYNPHVSSTVGAEYIFIRKTQYGADENGNPIEKKVKIGLWDTAGSERFDSMLYLYFRCAKIVLLCFWDNNLDPIKRYVNLAREYQPDVTVILCVTKCDLKNNIDYIPIQNWGKNNACLGICYTSAKENIGIEEVLDAIFMELGDKAEVDEEISLNLNSEENKEYRCINGCF